MLVPIYNLPEIHFVGGESQTLVFYLYTKTGSPFDVSDCSVGFAIVNYVTKNGEPILVKEDADIKKRIGDEGITNIVEVELSDDDTVHFQGRYIYQLTITDSEGESEIPGQGIVDIVRNIHQSFITQ